MAEERVWVDESQVVGESGGGASAAPVQAHVRVRKPQLVAWSLLASGVLFCVLGVVCFVWPGLALETVALIVGVGFLVAGVASLINFVVGGALRNYSGWFLVSAVADLVLGGIFIARPLVSIWVLTWLIAAAIMVVGVLQVISGVRARGAGASWVLHVVTGLVTLGLGVLMVVNPATLALWIAAFALVYGVALIVLAFRVPKAASRM